MNEIGYLQGNMKWEVEGWRLDDLYQKEQELERCKRQVERLRAKVRCLEVEKASMSSKAKEIRDGFIKAKAYAHAYGATIMKIRLGL